MMFPPSQSRPVDQQEASYRYERKFILDTCSWADFQLQLKLHPACFRTTYPPRYVNNFYLDTLQLAAYFDNIEGTALRTKFRVRWYGAMLGAIESPFLELKRKQGLVGTKRRFDLPAFQVPSTAKLAENVGKSLRAAELPAEIRHDLAYLRPSLMNRYYREYYESANGFRLTIDSQLQSFTAGSSGLSRQMHRELIVELKYDCEHERESHEMVQHFRLRVSRNSKYVEGMNF